MLTDSNSKLVELKEAYLQGEEIDWDSFYKGRNLYKVPIPTYPFKKKRCWFVYKNNIDSTFEQLRKNIELYTKNEAYNAGNMQTLMEKLNDYATIYLKKLFNKHHFFEKPGEEVELKSVKAEIGVVDEEERLFLAILNILEQMNLIEIRNDVIYTLDNVQMDKWNLSEKELLQKRSESIEEWSDTKTYLELLDECLINMENILNGSVLGTSVVFNESKPDLVKNIYKNNKYIDFYHELISYSIHKDVSLLRHNGSDNKKIRILEVGSGTGGASSGILQSIQKFNSIEYYYTDISKSLVDYGRNTYGNYKFVKFQKFNIEQNIKAQGIELGVFDIVIAYDVLHATRNIEKTLMQIKRLLRKNGKVFILEPTQRQNYSTLTFGTLSGWWAYEDGDVRIAHSPLLSTAGWSELLAKSGYSNSYFYSNEKSFETMIVSESDGHFTSEEIKKPIENRKNAESNSVEDIILDVWKECLGEENVGVNDNYFELGGDSIIALNVLKEINERLQVGLNVSELLQYQTVSELASYIEETYSKKSKLTLEADGSLFEKYCFEKNRHMSMYIASPAQKRIYIVTKQNKDSIINNLPKAYIIKGSIDKKKIGDVFRQIVDRHEALRTNLTNCDNDIVQIIHKDNNFVMEYEENEAADISECLDAFVKPFDLEKDLLFRGKLVTVNNTTAYLLIDMHHAISDGFSIEAIIAEFMSLYTDNKLDHIKYQYKDYAIWEAELEKKEEYQKAKEYWSNKFAAGYEILNFPTYYPRQIEDNRNGDILDFYIEDSLYAKVKQFASMKKTTIYNVCLSAFLMILNRYSGQSDITIGTVNAGRTLPEFEKIVGMFVNTLPLRNKVDDKQYYDEFLKAVSDESNKAFENQMYQFDQLVEDLKIEKQVSHNPLFDIMFIMQNMGDFSIQMEGMEILNIDYNYHMSKFDYTLLLTEANGRLKGTLEYNTNLFSKSFMERLGENYSYLLQEIVEDNNEQLLEFRMMPDEEMKVLLDEFNDSEITYGKYSNVVEIIDQNIATYPDSIALVYNDKKYTYKELDKKSNCISHMLQKQGAQKGDIIGILMDRSEVLIFSILGAMKIGCPYLVIDPEYPKDRIQYMVNDSRCNCILTSEKYQALGESIGNAMPITEYIVNNGDIDNVREVLNQSDLLYVIYTSGSSGKPKGVLVEHKGLVNYRNHCIRDLKLDNKAKILAFASPSFDAFESEMLMAFSLGGELHITDKNVLRDPELLEQFLYEHNINTLTLPPVLAEKVDFSKTKVKTLLTAGSEVKSNVVEKLKNHLNYFNAYGPTEDSICSTIWNYAEYDISSSVPIGKPIPNHKIYIMNSHHKLMPIGVPGELCVSGEGLARGYLNREDLNMQKFIVNPYTNERMYCTGDLARWLDDGNIEYLGRIDNQVKIRGFRIELGEIENCLLEIKEIKEAVVTTCQDENGKYLVAYYVADQSIKDTDIRTFLRDKLPDYMIPAAFMKIDYIPLTINGKFDSKAVPKVEKRKQRSSSDKAIDSEDAFIMDTLAKLLRHNDFDKEANLFDMGMDSIRIIQLAASLKENGYDISIGDIFTKPYISEIRKYRKSEEGKPLNPDEHIASKDDCSKDMALIREVCANNYERIISGKVTKRYGYRPIHMLFLKNSINSGSVIDFTSEENIESIKKKILEAISETEIFYTKIGVREFEIYERVDVEILVINTEEQRCNSIVNELFNRKHDKELPYEIVLLRYENNHYKLAIIINHIFYDGISNDLFTRRIKDKLSNISTPLNADYSEYAYKVGEYAGQCDISLLEREMELKEFLKLHKNVKKLKKKGFQRVCIPINHQKDVMGQVMESVISMTSDSYDGDERPVLLIFNGRYCEENGTAGAIGNCLDILPMVASKETTNDKIAYKTELLKSKKVNVLDILSETGKVDIEEEILKKSIILNIQANVENGLTDDLDKLKSQIPNFPDSYYYLVRIGSQLEIIGI